MISHHEYLGDGVYVVVEDGMIKLTTENGIETTNTIYLEVEVLKALYDWWTWVERRVRDE